jgi:hypothetical protein
MLPGYYAKCTQHRDYMLGTEVDSPPPTSGLPYPPQTSTPRHTAGGRRSAGSYLAAGVN